MRQRGVSVVTVVVLVFSGCVAQENAALDVAGSEASSVLRGVVTSDELFPVVGARVTVFNDVSVQVGTTAADGVFEIGNLLPGEFTINITADGYRAFVRALSIDMPGVVEERFELVGLPGLSPYVVTYLFTGYDICSLSAFYTAGWPNVGGPVGALPCPMTGEKKTAFQVDVEPRWAAGVHEMDWETSEEMIFSSSLVPGCMAGTDGHDPCPAMVWGHPPLRVFARPLDPEYAAAYAIDGKEMWPTGNHTSHIFTSYSGYLRTEVNGTFYNQCAMVNNQFDVPAHWGCPFGVGISLGVRFQMYHTTFYLAEPSDLRGFSAIPDG